jgi:cholesterol transport system auxiliary component
MRQHVKPPVLCAIVLAAAVLACSGGCSALTRSTPRKARYMLEVRRSTVSDLSPDGPILEVRSLSVAAPFADRGFVYRIDESVFESDYYNEFLSAPDRLLTGEVMDWMFACGLFSIVTDAYAGVKPGYALEGHVVELCGDYRPDREPLAVLQVQFMLIDVSGPRPSAVLFERYRREEPVKGTGPAALVVAWNRALAHVMAQFEDDVRKLELPPGA